MDQYEVCFTESIKGADIWWYCWLFRNSAPVSHLTYVYKSQVFFFRIFSIKSITVHGKFHHLPTLSQTCPDRRNGVAWPETQNFSSRFSCSRFLVNFWRFTGLQDGFPCGLVYLPSLKLTWPLKIDPWKRRFLLETTIFRCHVSFREGITNLP